MGPHPYGTPSLWDLIPMPLPKMLPMIKLQDPVRRTELAEWARSGEYPGDIMIRQDSRKRIYRLAALQICQPLKYLAAEALQGVCV